MPQLSSCLTKTLLPLSAVLSPVNHCLTDPSLSWVISTVCIDPNPGSHCSRSSIYRRERHPCPHCSDSERRRWKIQIPICQDPEIPNQVQSTGVPTSPKATSGGCGGLQVPTASLRSTRQLFSIKHTYTFCLAYKSLPNVDCQYSNQHDEEGML